MRVDVENVSNGSAVEALWALGAPEPKKRLKRPDGGLGCGGRGAENSSLEGVVFCHLFTDTETYVVNSIPFLVQMRQRQSPAEC